MLCLRLKYFYYQSLNTARNILCSMWQNSKYFKTRKTSDFTSILVGFLMNWTKTIMYIEKHISKHKSSTTNEGPDKKHKCQELCCLNGGTVVVGKTWFWKTNVWMCWKTQRKTSRTLTYWIQANLIVSQKPGRYVEKPVKEIKLSW